MHHNIRDLPAYILLYMYIADQMLMEMNIIDISLLFL